MMAFVSHLEYKFHFEILFQSNNGTEDRKAVDNNAAADEAPQVDLKPGQRERTDAPRSFASMSQLDYLDKSPAHHANSPKVRHDICLRNTLILP